MCVQNTPASLHHKILVKKRKKERNIRPLPLCHDFLSALLSGSDVRASAFGRPALLCSPNHPLLPHAKTPWPLPPPLSPCGEDGPPRRATGAFGTARKRKAERTPKATHQRGGPDAKKKAEHKTKSAHRRRKTPNEEIQRGQNEGHTTNCPRTRNPELSWRKQPQRSATDDGHEAKFSQPRNTSTNGLSF